MGVRAGTMTTTRRLSSYNGAMGGTVVFQSYRANAPPWLEGCMGTVRAWAAAQGFTYRFFGDELFDRVSAPVRIRIEHFKNTLADVARLLVAKELLAEGFARAIWIDADVRIFDPGFTVETARGFAFSREVWVEPRGEVIGVDDRINNCVCAFDAGGSFLPFYIDACHAMLARASGALSQLMMSTQLLTQLDRLVPLTLLDDVGMASPWVLRDLARGGGPNLDLLRARSRAPLRAVNLCASLVGRRFDGFTTDIALVEAAIANLSVLSALPAIRPELG
jgi:hypothetical protein